MGGSFPTLQVQGRGQLQMLVHAGQVTAEGTVVIRFLPLFGALVPAGTHQNMRADTKRAHRRVKAQQNAKNEGTRISSNLKF